MQAQLPSTVSDLEIRDEFATLPVTAKFKQVAELLSKNRVNIILVTEGKSEEVIGVITENRFLKICSTGINPSKSSVKDNIQTNILRLRSDTPVDAALRLLDENKPAAVIVMDTERSFIGYLSPKDFRKMKLEHSAEFSLEEDYKFAKKNHMTKASHSNLPLIKPTTPAPYHRISAPKNTIPKKGIERLESDVNQLVKLALHFCSDDGRRNQCSSRTGIRHEHLFCIGKAGPAETRGVWAVDETEMANIVQKSLASQSDVKDDMYCLAWLSDGDNTIPTSWLSKVDSIWKSNMGEYQLNCFIMNQTNPLLKPEVITVRKLSKRNVSKFKKRSGVSQIESLANDLITYKGSENLAHNRILLCASISAE